MTISLKADTSGTSGSIQVNGVDVANFGPGIPLSNRNKIINGGFNINQRAYVSGAAVGTNLYGLDRWKMAASADTFTFSTTDNKTTVTIPDGKVFRQVVEGLNLQTGTYTLSWEGTAQGKIGAGSLSTSGVTGSITGGVDTTIEFGPGTVANVQLEIGSVATPFEHRPYGTELALCQRYLPALRATNAFEIIGVGQAYSATAARVQFRFPVDARIPPTGVFLSSAVHFSCSSASATGIAASGVVSIVGAGYKSGWIDITGLSGFVAGNSTMAYLNVASAYLYFTGCEL